ncbi:LysR family transcriptional regulator [Magnetofaba australis]|uniref:Putative LysR family transcriptional regulator n=1 Tax=Magnetofaba australis IT-1 TaxID=1434232 RepID=A0A1Y2K0T3_9PROT|nr:LysR family transcriptional regulator [Magnetofaba australis]OSM01559.1 putative LysR family transcriptional regulator [Magnetofaba australis IT-1]
MKEGLGKFDLNLLVAFDALMTERGVTRAGRRLGITQAAMSNTLRRLRTAFDDALFVKTGARMEPTPRALELAGMIESALDLVHEALDQDSFDPATSRYVFRMGMVDYTAPLVFPPLLEQMERNAPNVTLEVANTGDFHGEMIESGEVDLILSRVEDLPPNVHHRLVREMPFVVLFRPDHPVLAHGGATLKNVLACKHVHYYPPGIEESFIDVALDKINAHRDIAVKLESFGMLPTLVSQTDLIATINKAAADVVAPAMGLTSAPLPFPCPPLQLAMAWHDRTEHSQPNIWFREQVQQALNAPRPQ